MSRLPTRRWIGLTLFLVLTLPVSSAMAAREWVQLFPTGTAPHEVEIDIKPGSSQNSINLRSHGTVAVAILSTPTFDAATVDPLTITLAGAPARLRGGGVPMASPADVNGDGLADLVVHVSMGSLQLGETDEDAV